MHFFTIMEVAVKKWKFSLLGTGSKKLKVRAMESFGETGCSLLLKMM